MLLLINKNAMGYQCKTKTFLFFSLFLLSLEGIAQTQAATKRDSLLKKLATLPVDTNRVLLLSDLCWEYRSYKPDSSYYFAQQSLEIARTLNYPKGELLALKNLAIAFSALGEMGKALKTLNQAYELSIKINEIRLQATILNNMADVYMRRGEWKIALEKMQKCYAVYQTLPKDNNPRSKIIYFVNIAECFYNLKELDSANAYLNQALALIQPGYHIDLGVLFYGLGDVALAKNKPKEAYGYYQKSRAFSLQEDNFADLYEVYYRMSNLFQKTNQSDSVLHYAQLALTSAQKGPYYIGVLNSSQLLTALYEGKNDTEALRYYKIAVVAKDSLFSQDKVRRLLSISFEEKEKIKEIEAEKVAYRNKTNLFILAVMLAVLGLTAVILYRNNRQQQKANTLLEKQKEILDDRTEQLRTSLEEKEGLLKEIHHRVKNNLEVISSLLTLQTTTITDKKAKAALAEGQSRVQSIALIHHKLYRDEALASVELRDFIDDLFKQVRGLFHKGDGKVEFTLIGNETRIDTNTAIPIGLILNELFTNAFKYAVQPNKDTKISVHLQEAEGWTNEKKMYKIIYRDNGPGLPENITLEKASSLGMKVIKLLTKQIKGHLHLYNDKGAVFEISFSHHQSTRKNATN